MANTTQDDLYETFLAISAGQAAIPDPMTDASAELAKSVSDAAPLMESAGATFAAIAPPAQAAASTDAPVGPVAVTPAAPVVQPTTPATTTTAGTVNDGGSITSTLLNQVFGMVPAVGTATSAVSSGGGIGSTLESIGKDVLESGFGMVPLIGGLLGLFDGGSSTTPTPLAKYAMPAAMSFQGAETDSAVTDADYDQMGMPRTYDGSGGSTLAASSTSGGGSSSATGAVAPAPTASPQITVNVQAMDARSFLDRSSDIAAAVRDAMLSLNPINDVVNDL